MSPDPADIAAMREQGDLLDFVKSLTGRPPKAPKERHLRLVAEKPCFHIARPGAWPCGTAASGPTPGPTCPDCRKETRP